MQCSGEHKLVIARGICIRLAHKGMCCEYGLLLHYRERQRDRETEERENQTPREKDKEEIRKGEKEGDEHKM